LDGVRRQESGSASGGKMTLIQNVANYMFFWGKKLLGKKGNKEEALAKGYFRVRVIGGRSQ